MRFFRFKKLVSMETSKYLRYAVGEVVLVVIGILIALQINNWNENRKENIVEQTLLKQLLKDFESNDTIIRNGLSEYKKNLKFQNVIIKNTGPNVIKPENEKTLDSISILNYIKVGLVFGSLNFTSQQIEKISNPQLKIYLSKFPSIFKSYKETENRIADLTINQRQIHQKYISLLDYKFEDEFLIYVSEQDEDILSEFNQEKFISDYSGWLRNREFQNITVDKSWVSKKAIRELNILSKENKTIIDLIKKEIRGTN